MSRRPKFEVEKLLERREGNLEYQIKWEGSRKLTWEPADNFHNGQAVNSKFKVEAIVGERRAGCEFLVKWKGYTNLEWVPKENLDGANRLLQKFDDENVVDFSEDEEMLLSEDDHNSKTADLNESLNESDFATLSKKYIELKKRYKELEQKLAKLNVSQVTQIYLCSCPGSCPDICLCKGSRLECWSGCSCKEICSNFDIRTITRTKIQRSTVTHANNGCFAKEDIKKGEIIGEYIGKLILPVKKAEDGKSQYLAELNYSDTKKPKRDDLVIDAQFSGSNVTRANHKNSKAKKGKITQVNGELVVQHLRTEENSRVGLGIFVRATRDIMKDEEIFIDYGPRYPTKDFQ